MANNFSGILKSFGDAISSFSRTLSDNRSGRSIETEIVERDKKYTELLDNYLRITKTRNCVKEIHKWIFFWIVVVSCAVVVYLVYKTINRLLQIEEYDLLLKSVPIFITAFGSCVTAVIVIPLAIAKFLFNTKEDDNIAGIIQHMQDHDMAGMTLLKERFSKIEHQKDIEKAEFVKTTNDLDVSFDGDF